jgi:hypothetical protein
LIFDPGDLEENGAAVAVTVFRPSVDRQVLVVAAVDVAAVEARLRSQLGNRLCVIPARWTKPQLDTAFGHLQDRWQHWKLYAASPHNDEYGQPSIHARLVRITREIADWIDTCPDGLVTLTPWLTPLDR